MHFLRRFPLIVATVCLLAQVSLGQVSVLTQHNDNSRTGQNTQEAVLTTSNVNVAHFGKLFARTVDGYIYAQPLYVPNLTLGGKTRNVVYVATENNSVYAFDADDPNATAPLWQVNLGTAVPSQDICTPPVYGCPYVDLVPEIGITATPVIDSGTSTMYLVAKTKNTTNNTYHYFIHALDLLTGVDKFGPVEITAAKFAPLYENNRSGLLLDPSSGNIYIAFSSVGDYPTWYGFVMAYSASTLQQMAVLNVTPSTGEGGIWGGGQGLVGDNVDSVYAVTSNGSFDVNTGGSDYGDSVLKLSTSQSLKIVDYFTPDNQSYLGTHNVDLGAGGQVLLPPANSELVGGGKDGVLRVISTTNMGKFNPTFNSDVQEWQATPGIIMGAPIYWSSPLFGPAIYLWGPGDYLKAWTFNGTTFNTTPKTQSTIQSVAGEANSVPLSVSSNGSQAGTGIIWAAAPYSGDANPQTVPGILRAFDASNLSNELWDSKQNAARDDVGNYAKFNPPTIANGKVYLGTFSGQLLVYGLNPPNNYTITFVQVNAATPQSTTPSVAVPYKSPQTIGDLNVVVVGWNDTASSIQSVKDSAGNTYTLGVGPTKGTGITQAIYYAKNIVGGSNTVTVTFNQAASYPDVRVLEYNNVDPTSPLDVTATGVGKSKSASTASATTTSANDVIVGADTVYTGNLGPGPAFTARIITSPDSDLAEDRVVNIVGSYNASAPLSASGNWVMQLAAFKQKGSGTNPAPSVSSVSPNSGPAGGGTAVTITGANFLSGATVTFGGTAATNVVVASSTSITATTPPHAAGTVNVTVTNPDGQSGTLSNGFTYQSAGGSISFVQVAAATPQSATQTVTVAYTAAQTAGDLNIVVVGWNDASSQVSSVADTAGNSYSLAVGPTTGTNLRQSIYYAPNIKGGSNSVKVSFNQAASYPDIRVLEYAGLNTASPLDAVHGASGNGSTANSGSATTTAATELIFGADTVYTGNKAAGSGFTARIFTSPDSDLAEDETVSSTGSYAATATLTSSGNWVMQVATFKP